MRNRWRSSVAVAALAVVATLLAPSAIVGTAAAQTVDEIEGRDRILFDREAQLNEYRCQYNVDTQIVPGGCTDGMPAVDPVSPLPFTGTPTEAEIALRDRLISAQHALLNAYRCLFNFETELVPGGCGAGEPDGDQASMVPDFPIDDTTTGNDMLAIISEAETSCLSTVMGDDDFADFQGTPLVETAAVDGTYSIWVDCLEFDNLLAVATGLVSNTGGGWEQSSRQCAAAIARNHPELVFYVFDLSDRIAEEGFSLETQSNLIGFYECLTAEEEVTFNVVVRGQHTNEFSGQDLLDILPASEAECLQTNLAESDYDGFANSPDVLAYQDQISPALLVQIVSCLSAETIDRFPKEIVMGNLGIRSEESRACAFTFFDEHPQYISLVVEFASGAESLTSEEVLQVADEALILFSCMTQDEIQFFVENYLPLIVP